jgi:hypothetical protein
MIPILVTRETHEEASALSRFVTMFSDRTPDGEYVIWVDLATHGRLSSCDVGNHVGTRRLPGGAEGIVRREIGRE